MEFVIRDGKLNQYRDCPDCDEFLKDHPSLKVRGVLRQKRKKDGTWYHLIKSGQILHGYVAKINEKSPGEESAG